MISCSYILGPGYAARSVFRHLSARNTTAWPPIGERFCRVIPSSRSMPGLLPALMKWQRNYHPHRVFDGSISSDIIKVMSRLPPTPDEERFSSELRSEVHQLGRGRALDALETLIYKHVDLLRYGNICLRVYRGTIDNLSVSSAKDALDADNASERVRRWCLDPAIRRAIEKNFHHNREMVDHIAYILVGAGNASILKHWLLHKPVVTFQHYKNAMKSRFPDRHLYFFRSNLATAIFRALLAWNPTENPDDAYQFYIWASENLISDDKQVDDKSLRQPHSPFTELSVVALRHVLPGLRGSPELYDRFKMLLLRHMWIYHIDIKEEMLLLQEARMSMCHPTSPSYLSAFALLQEIDRDPDHILRFTLLRESIGTPVPVARDHYYFFTRTLMGLLKADGKIHAASWVNRIYNNIWSDGTPFMNDKERKIGYEKAMRRKMLKGCHTAENGGTSDTERLLYRGNLAADEDMKERFS